MVVRSSPIQARNISGNTRHLGLAHWQRPTGLPGDVITVRGYVDEWVSSNMQVRVVTNQAWNSIGSLTAFIISVFGVPAVLAQYMIVRLITLGIFAWEIFGSGLRALGTTNLTGTRVEQRIRGTGGGRTATLPMNTRLILNSSCGIVRSLNSYDSTGTFNTSHWGTPTLGRHLMWAVFGIDVVPTSWTGTSG